MLFSVLEQVLEPDKALVNFEGRDCEGGCATVTNVFQLDHLKKTKNNTPPWLPEAMVLLELGLRQVQRVEINLLLFCLE